MDIEFQVQNVRILLFFFLEKKSAILESLRLISFSEQTNPEGQVLVMNWRNKRFANALKL